MPPIDVKACTLPAFSALQLEEILVTRLRGCPGNVECVGSDLSVEIKAPACAIPRFDPTR